MAGFADGVFAALIDPIIIIGGLIAGFAADRRRWVVFMAVVWAIVLGVVFAAISPDLQSLPSIATRMAQFAIACLAIGAVAFLAKTLVRRRDRGGDADDAAAPDIDRRP